jgi:cephalosporin-C deacetylase-like acetyl esterase
VFLDIDGEKIHGWWVPSLSGSGPLPVILHFHGNAGAFILCRLLPPASYSIHHAKLPGNIGYRIDLIRVRSQSHHHAALSTHLSTDAIHKLTPQ